MSTETRNPLDDAPPIRKFYITQRCVDGLFESVVVEGHVPQVLGDGSLQILRYKRDIPWTVKFVAAGDWHSLEADIPNDEDIDALEAYNTRYGTKQQLMAGRSSKTAH